MSTSDKSGAAAVEGMGAMTSAEFYQFYEELKKEYQAEVEGTDFTDWLVAEVAQLRQERDALKAKLEAK